MSKSQHMGYHGGKGHWGKKKAEVSGHCPNPSDAQTRTESSKNLGMNYTPPGMEEGTVDCNSGKK